MRRNPADNDNVAKYHAIRSGLGADRDAAMVRALKDMGFPHVVYRQVGPLSLIGIAESDWMNLCAHFSRTMPTLYLACQMTRPIDESAMVSITRPDHKDDVSLICEEYGIIAFPVSGRFGHRWIMAPPSAHEKEDRPKIREAIAELQASGATVTVPKGTRKP